MDEDKLIVNQTKKGIFLFSLGAAVMTILPIILMFVSDEIISEIPILNIIPGSVIIFRVLMAFGAIFFGFCLVFIVRRAAKAKAVLIADENGITDRSSALALGFIPWHDISYIRLRPFMNEMYIEVGIEDKDKYLSNLGWLKKMTIKSNVRMGFSICLITLNGTGEKPEMIVPKLNALFAKFQRSDFEC